MSRVSRNRSHDPHIPKPSSRLKKGSEHVFQVVAKTQMFIHPAKNSKILRERVTLEQVGPSLNFFNRNK